MKFPKRLIQFSFWLAKRRRTILICKNTSSRRFGKAKLPVRQNLYWLGPIFVNVQG